MYGTEAKGFMAVLNLSNSSSVKSSVFDQIEIEIGLVIQEITLKEILKSTQLEKCFKVSKIQQEKLLDKMRTI